MHNLSFVPVLHWLSKVDEFFYVNGVLTLHRTLQVLMEVIVSVDGYETLTDQEAVRKAERLNLKKGVVMTKR
jgi:hypothetical protein